MIKNAIEVKNLEVRYTKDKAILEDINLNVKRGEIFGILGGSGHGKTSLLSCLIMLLPIYKGDVKIFGNSLRNLDEKKEQHIKNLFGVMFQFGALFSNLNVIENISLPLKEYTKLPKNLINSIGMVKLRMVGLKSNVADLYPFELSGGMVKRVALARALALDSKLIFLDEPTSGLDYISAKAFVELIKELREALDLTFVIITHNPLVIETLLDRLIVLRNKKIFLSGSYEDVKDKIYESI